MYFPIIDVLKENFIAKIPSIVTKWLTDNVDPVGSAVVVDTSLSISGAAADAKITGDELNDLKSTLDDFTDTRLIPSEVPIDSVTFTENYVCPPSGSVQTNANYHYSSRISVQEGDEITSETGLRMVCAYSNNVAVVASGSSDQISTYTVPSGIDKIIVTVSKTTTTIKKVVYEAEYYVKTDKSLTESDVPADSKTVGDTINIIDDIIGTVRGGDILRESVDSLEQGDAIYLARNSIICNKKYLFNSKVSSSNNWQILIAHGVTNDGDTFDSNVYSAGFKVSPTSCILWVNGKDGEGGTNPVTWTHGLEISDRLSVIISVDKNQVCKVTLMSEHGTVEHTFEAVPNAYDGIFNGRKGEVYAKALIGSFNNCELSFVSSDLEKPIWLFGDSYVSVITTRYPYYLVQNNMNNCLFNSYPGEASQNALLDAKSLLNLCTPKFLVWCIGMNDHDTNLAPNSNWLSAIEELEEICAAKNITLVLATIPNVTAPSYNNTYKNAWVEQSGYRYIDFAKAIGNSWGEGWLSDDGVHPTAMGARVLAGQIMLDLPELAQP